MHEPLACHSAPPFLVRTRSHRKIAKGEEEIAEAESRSQLAPLACDIA